MRRKLIGGIVLSALFLAASAQKPLSHDTKILLIPLDDRPTSQEFTENIAKIGNADIISPPKDLLGHFTVPGQSDQIISWVKKQDIKTFDAAIIALDMLAYGGLVASRTHEVSLEEAVKRIQYLQDLKRIAPGIKIFVQNVIMRIAPTVNTQNEAYRSRLAEWGEVSVARDRESRAKTKALEQQIPAEVLNDYKQARKRNLQINILAVDLVKKGVIDYLILSQDDAKPIGVHVADREALAGKVKKAGLSKKVSIQPGADEVSMLLLARTLGTNFNYSPAVKVIYSSESMSKAVMPYEDQQLNRTVSNIIRSAGCREQASAGNADILFYIFTSRLEEGRAESFAKEINSKIREGRQIVVADIDPLGNVQGGDSIFTFALQRHGLFPALYGYASWNTAANTVGTALVQGVVFSLAQKYLLQSVDLNERILSAQNWFTMHRVLDDFYYHHLVRARLKAHIAETNQTNKTMGPAEIQRLRAMALDLMNGYFVQFGKNYISNLRPFEESGFTCDPPSNLQLDFPWQRIFEARIAFDLRCTTLENKTKTNLLLQE